MSCKIDPENVYVNHAKFEATPMTRADYNELRGWTLPKDENPEDDGFLLQSVSDPNHISWVTKEVFESSYRRAGMTR